MSQIKQHFDGILSELAKSPQLAVQELLDCGHSLFDVLPIATTLRPIQQFNLLQGLLYAQSEVLFFERMVIEAEQKQALARYCYEHCGLKDDVRRFLDDTAPDLTSIFFESGSTVAHCIGRLADRLSDAQRKRSHAQSIQTKDGKEDLEPESRPLLGSTVITNNLTGVTALAGLVEQLEPVQGRLSLKYFGFIPFSESDSANNWRVEGRRYNLLAEDIESCEGVFATCSNFSFLAGPIVGTRGNCLTKRAMYSGAERWDDTVAKNYYLLLHFEKIVPLVNTYSDLAFDAPKKHCGCVFMQPPRAVAEAIHKWLYQHDEHDAIKHEHFDGTWHDEMRVLSLEGRHPYTAIRIPVEKFAEGMTVHHVKVPHRLNLSWLEWVEQSVGMHILISLPREKAKSALDCIRTEIERVNSVTEIAGYGARFVIANSDSAIDSLVVQVDREAA